MTDRNDESPESRKPLDRDPQPPPRDAIASVQGRILDPATALTIKGVRPRPTVYVGPRLVISKSVDVAGAIEVLTRIARPLGWSVELQPEDPRTEGLKLGVRVVEINVASDHVTMAPDGWTLLQQTRAQFGVEAVKGVGLDHVVFPGRSARTRTT